MPSAAADNGIFFGVASHRNRISTCPPGRKTNSRRLHGDLWQSGPEKKWAVEFLTLVAAGNVREAYDRHIVPGFRHHNPNFRGDAVSLMEAMEQNALQNPGKILEVQIGLQDGDYVAVFSRIRQKPSDLGGAVVHILRFLGDRIIELWDIGQEVPENSVNENGMF